jgi:hypothetical protein
MNSCPTIENYENITLSKEGVNKNILAKIDTGADYSSIDIELAQEFNLIDEKKFLGVILVKNSNGKTRRKVYWTQITLKNQKIKTIFTVVNRSHLKYKILIGRADLENFLVKPSQENLPFLKKVENEI